MKNIIDFLKKLFIIIINFIKNHIIQIVIVATLTIISIICILTYLYKPYKVDKDFSKINLEGYNKLMIVAHPDDEMLWGGAHLIEDDYLVVCITCGGDKIRVNEFKNVMKATNNKYIMLNYPDKTNGERDNWDKVYDDITKDINEIIDLKSWETVVTHNPQGEYGHIHHKMTNAIVTELMENKEKTGKLYYFGRYHSKKKINEFYSEMTPIEDIYFKQKRQILGMYTSQYFIQTMFDHMYGYEDWENYDSWKGSELE